MSYQICTITNQRDWEQLPPAPGSDFFASWDWGEFQTGAGNTAVRLGVYADGRAVGRMQGFWQKLPLGLKYVYFPRVVVDGNWIKAIAQALPNAHWLRFELCERIKNQELKTENFLLYPTSYRQPSATLLVDITGTDDAVLGRMHQKTRYNIRVAERHGVRVDTEKNAEIFWQLNQETTARDGFTSHHRSYYEKMLALPAVTQLTAWHHGKAIASIICITNNQRCTYLHGASSSSARSLMAPYALQWKAIQQARTARCLVYDLWGISPPVETVSEETISFHNIHWNKSHPWSGITRFKAGFGGTVATYPQPVDIVLSPLLYRAVHFVRQLISR